ncbi:MAG: phenylacetate-CoA oxygenase subunit PaaJ [Proteobacteria bacterium]|nr:phenylacetate-CoA oxygenase subunit PaaJ [Pseudomonadota bacterium]
MEAGLVIAGAVTADLRIARARAAIASVCDPEIPVLTLDDLGVIREVAIAADGEIEVAITPTYSGCPAMGAMALDLQAALASAGFPKARIRNVLSPAWTTDWMTARGREKLAAYGIAPPAARASRRALFGEDNPLACPRCGSTKTVKVSEFGSTACKAHWRCESCLEPFDAFKCI